MRYPELIYDRKTGNDHTSHGPGVHRQAADEVCRYDGDMPGWFSQGIKAALLAPTALNKQPFFIEGAERRVRITCSSGLYSDVDLGIVKYHFEIGAGAHNFEWL